MSAAIITVVCVACSSSTNETSGAGDGGIAANTSSVSPASGGGGATKSGSRQVRSLNPKFHLLDDPDDGGDTDGGDEAGGGGGDNGDGGDGAAPHPVSEFCGDDIRDPVTEECDDGATTSDVYSLCSPDCHVLDALAWKAGVPPMTNPSRTLGTGRHPIGGGAQGFAVTWLEPAGPSLRVTYYAEDGTYAGHADEFGLGAQGTSQLTSAAPSIAELGNGKYAAVYTDFEGDGDEDGIALRLLDPAQTPAGASGHANATTIASQSDADVIWTGSSVVVAWTDWSDPTTSPDIRYRTFDANLNPTMTMDGTIAATGAFEAEVALAPFAGGFAAAWRQIDATFGNEEIIVQAGATVWNTTDFTSPDTADPPALVALDATHLLLAYTEGSTDGTSAVRVVVLSTDAPGNVNANVQNIVPSSGVDGGPFPNTYRPSASLVGSSVFVTFGTAASSGDPLGEEIYLKELPWDGATLDGSQSMMPLPRAAGDQAGDQRFGATFAIPQWPGGALVCAWNDLGTSYQSEAKGDVAVELIPVPIVRMP